MNNEIVTIKFGSIINRIFDIGSNGSDAQISNNLNMHDSEDYALMVRTVNFNANDFVNNMKYISRESYEFFKKSKLYGNEIIINKIGSPGTIGYMPVLNKPVSLGLNQFAIILDNSVDNKYIYHYLKYNEKYIKSLAHGSVTKSITQDDIKKASLIIPKDINEQIKIREFIDILDQIINNNNLIIDRNSNILMTSYNYWFTQFCFPENSGKFKYSKKLKKEIPNDWKEINIKDIVLFDKGVEPGTDEYLTESNINTIPFYRVSDLENDDSTIYVDKKISKYSNIAEIGDILLTFDGTIGKMNLNCYGLYSTGIKRIKMKDKSLSDLIAYCIFNSDYAKYTLKKHTTGSVIKHGSRGLDYLYIAYDAKVFKQFSDRYSPIYEQMIKMIKINNKINQLKKYYVPLLLNNQIHLENKIKKEGK